MLRKLLVFITAACLQVGLVNSQENLSNKYDDFSIIEVKGNLEFSDYLIVNTEFEDYEIPACSRMYPGISSYFGFTIPSTGRATISAEIDISGLFGMAVYLQEDDGLVEIICDVYRGGKGHLTILDNDFIYAGKNAVGRIWLIDENHEATIKLAVTERPAVRIMSGSETRIISDEHFENYLHSDNLNQLSTDEKFEMLEIHHKQFADLPYEKEVIFKEIFPKLQTEKAYIAPNYPVKVSNPQETNEKIRYWIENYPDEFEHYFHFVNQVYEQYK